jgi:hypothetical protein
MTFMQKHQTVKFAVASTTARPTRRSRRRATRSRGVTLPAEDGSKQITAFELVDNFQGDSAFRNTRIPHFELKKVPKFKRTPAAEV